MGWIGRRSCNEGPEHQTVIKHSLYCHPANGSVHSNIFPTMQSILQKQKY